MGFFKLLAMLFRKKNRYYISFDLGESSYFKAISPNPKTIVNEPKDTDEFSFSVTFMEGVTDEEIALEPWSIFVVENTTEGEKRVFEDKFHWVYQPYEKKLEISGIGGWNENMKIYVIDKMNDDDSSSSAEDKLPKWTGDTKAIGSVEWMRHSLHYHDNALYYGETKLMDVTAAQMAGTSEVEYNDGSRGTVFPYSVYRNLFLNKPLPDGWRLPTCEDVYDLYYYGFGYHATTGHGGALTSFQNWQNCETWWVTRNTASSGNNSSLKKRLNQWAMSGDACLGNLSFSQTDRPSDEYDPSDSRYPKYTTYSLYQGPAPYYFPNDYIGEKWTSRELHSVDDTYTRNGTGEVKRCRDKLGLSLRSVKGFKSLDDEYYTEGYWLDATGFIGLQRQPKAKDKMVFADEGFITNPNCDSASYAYSDSLIPTVTHTEVIDGVTTIFIDSSPGGHLYSHSWETVDHTYIYACDYGAEENVAYWGNTDPMGNGLGEHISGRTIRRKYTDGSTENWESDITDRYEIRLVRDVQ